MRAAIHPKAKNNGSTSNHQYSISMRYAMSISMPHDGIRDARIKPWKNYDTFEMQWI
jgi:hypothetical protein